MARAAGYTHNRNWAFSGDTTDISRSEAYAKWQEAGQPTGTNRSKPETEFGPVSSSWLTGLGYNADTEEALATFKGTNEIFYYPMDYQTYLSWRASPSKGKWLHDHLSGGHFYRKESGFRGKAQSDRVLQSIANRQNETTRAQGEMGGTFLYGKDKRAARQVLKNYMGDYSDLESIPVRRPKEVKEQITPFSELPMPSDMNVRKQRYTRQPGEARGAARYR